MNMVWALLAYLGNLDWGTGGGGDGDGTRSAYLTGDGERWRGVTALVCDMIVHTPLESNIEPMKSKQYASASNKENASDPGDGTPLDARSLWCNDV